MSSRIFALCCLVVQSGTSVRLKQTDRLAGENSHTSTPSKAKVHTEDAFEDFCDQARDWSDPLQLRAILCSGNFQAAFQAEARSECSTMLVDLMNPEAMCTVLNGKVLSLYYPVLDAYFDVKVNIADRGQCEALNANVQAVLVERRKKRLDFNTNEVKLYVEAVEGIVKFLDTAEQTTEEQKKVREDHEFGLASLEEDLKRARDSTWGTGGCPTDDVIENLADAQRKRVEADRVVTHLMSLDPGGPSNAAADDREAEQQLAQAREDIYCSCPPDEWIEGNPMFDIKELLTRQESLPAGSAGPFRYRFEFLNDLVSRNVISKGLTGIRDMLQPYDGVLAGFMQHTNVMTDVLTPGMLEPFLKGFHLQTSVHNVMFGCTGKIIMRNTGVRMVGVVKDLTEISVEHDCNPDGHPKGLPAPQPNPQHNASLCDVLRCTVCEHPRQSPPQASQGTNVSSRFAGLTGGSFLRGLQQAGSVIFGSTIVPLIPQRVHRSLIRFLAYYQMGPLIAFLKENQYQLLAKIMSGPLLTRVLGGLVMDVDPEHMKVFCHLPVLKVAERLGKKILQNRDMFVQCVQDEIVCDTATNYIPTAAYEEEALTGLNGENPVYGAPNDDVKAVEYCKAKCSNGVGMGRCVGFFYAKTPTNQETCGYYMKAPDWSQKAWNQDFVAGSRICWKVIPP